MKTQLLWKAVWSGAGARLTFLLGTPRSPARCRGAFLSHPPALGRHVAHSASSHGRFPLWEPSCWRDAQSSQVPSPVVSLKQTRGASW